MFPDSTRLVILGTLLAWSAEAGHAQERCPDGSAPAGVIGVGLYHCVGGVCTIADGPDRRMLNFSTEPRLRDVAPWGPGASRLREGDVLVAVDGIPITLPAAGRRLATLGVGQSVVVTVRRQDAAREVVIETRAGCSIGSLAVTRDTAHPALQPALRLTLPALRTPALPRADTPAGDGRLEHLRARPNPGSLGFAIACARCGWVQDSTGGHRWQAGRQPTVARVDPGGPAETAGIKPGDVLTHIDELDITTRAGSNALADVRAGVTYRVRLLRGGRPYVVPVRTVPAVP